MPLQIRLSKPYFTKKKTDGHNRSDKTIYFPKIYAMLCCNTKTLLQPARHWCRRSAQKGTRCGRTEQLWAELRVHLHAVRTKTKTRNQITETTHGVRLIYLTISNPPIYIEEMHCDFQFQSKNDVETLGATHFRIELGCSNQAGEDQCKYAQCWGNTSLQNRKWGSIWDDSTREFSVFESQRAYLHGKFLRYLLVVAKFRNLEVGQLGNNCCENPLSPLNFRNQTNSCSYGGRIDIHCFATQGKEK